MNRVLRYVTRVLLVWSLGVILFGLSPCEGRLHLSVVNTWSGRISGLFDDETNVTQFRSIPYAKPPIGERRFRPPQPILHWRGILNATQNPPACMQRHHPMPNRRPEKMSEDCLYLHVYVPGVQPEDADEKYPVLVWIHGGDFVYGSSSFIDFSSLSSLGQMIVVSISYRLDIFGYLSSGDERLLGNAGLLDQHLALEWIYENIEAFGGDTSRITLYGESTGATCVYYHVASPSSKGLFSRAIIGGGVFIEGSDSETTFKNVVISMKCDAAHFLVQNQTEEDMSATRFSDRFLKNVLLDEVEPFDPIRCLQNQSAHSLLELSTTLPRHSFVPVVDSHYVLVSLTKAFSPNPAQRRNPFGVSCLIGVNSDGVPIRQTWNHNNREMFLSHLDALGKTQPKNKETIFIHSDLENENSSSTGDLTRFAIHSKYYSDRKPYSRTLRDAYNSKYVSFIQAVTEAMSSSSPLPVFLYYFTLKASFVKTGDDVEASQTDELPFIFGNVLNEDDINATPAEKRLSEDMIKIWSSFIADGVPQLPNGVKWPPYEKTNRTYVELNVNITADNVKQRLREGDRIFWNELMPKLMKMNAKPQNNPMNNMVMTTSGHMHHNNMDMSSKSIAWGMSDQAVRDLLLSLLIIAIFLFVICLTLITMLCKVRTIRMHTAKHNGALESATDSGNDNKAFTNDTTKSRPESITAL